MLAPLPAPRRLTLVTSPDDCNLGCAMCREHSPHAAPAAAGVAPRRLPEALARRLLADPLCAAIEEVVPSTMGEPLLWAGMDGLVDACAARGVKLNVTTNGTWPGRGASSWAERLAPAASDVKVSWNAAEPATAAALMGGLDLAAAIAGVRAFAAVRDRLRAAGRAAARLSFQVTAQERNVGELAAVVTLAAALGVERVKVNQLQVHHAALAAEDLRASPAGRARWNAAVRAMRAAAEAAGGDGRRVALEGAVPWAERGAPVEQGPCPFLGREAWALWDGRFAPCPHPAAWAGALGDFGPAGAAAWEGAAYRALVAGYADRDPCRSCPFRRAGGA
jgi:MoaA/NifB/PqqE/SkfB family radical SAM enzyme